MRHLIAACLVAGCSSATSHTITTASPDGGGGVIGDDGGTGGGTGPIALVYRGPASCDGCAEAAAAVLQGFDVHYVGPNENLKITAETLAVATLYVQPGSALSVPDSFDEMSSVATAIDQFVHDGGRYLGFADGGYLAGKNPGYELIPGDSDSYITSANATITTPQDTVATINWRGQTRQVYFQDAPIFKIDQGAQGVTVLATYDNGTIASIVAPFGYGKIGLVGPHVEADLSWYGQYSLVDTDGTDFDLALDLIDTLMQ